MASLPRTLIQEQQIRRALINHLRSSTNPKRRTSNLSSPNLSIAAGQNENEILKNLNPLLRDYGGGRWAIIPNGKGIHADFRFRTFKRTWVSSISHTPSHSPAAVAVRLMYTPCQEFMCTIASQCERERHHPEWCNVCSNNILNIMRDFCR